MTFTYDLATNIGKVRLKIRDTDSTKELFSDEELQVFINDNNADLDLAAADALDSLAANAALLAKMEKIGDYQIDSRNMAAALRAAASRFREKSEETPVVGIAEQSLSDFNATEIIWKDVLSKG